MTSGAAFVAVAPAGTAQRAAAPDAVSAAPVSSRAGRDATTGERIAPVASGPRSPADAATTGPWSPADSSAPGSPPPTDPAAFGPLAALLADERVTDVFVNPDGSVWADRGTGCQRAPRIRLPPDAARELAVRLVSLGDRHVDEATPCADVRLGRLRVHAVLPPVAGAGATLSIRVRPAVPVGLDDLDSSGFFREVPLASVRELVDRRANLLITGAGGSGKTTFLAALLASAPATERIIVLEDVAELDVPHPHVVALETRQANLEGAGAVGLAQLVREALRMRPDRLVVGECRGAELRELLAALNTGHDGGAGTLHANSLADVPARLEALATLAGLTADAVARQAVSAFDAVLHVERTPAGRRLVAVGRLGLGADGRLAVTG